MPSVRFKFKVNTVRAQQYLQEVAEAWARGAERDYAKVFSEVQRLIAIELTHEDIPSEVECGMLGLESGYVRLGPELDEQIARVELDAKTHE